MIEVDDFQTVLAVIETGGINKASEVLHRVPSAISMRIQNLESRLGVSLFVKNGRHLHPTSSALQLAQDARQILSLVRKAENKVRKQEPGGLLRLGATDSLAGTRLTESISKLIKRYPGIDLELKVASSDEISEAILQRKLDAGLMVSHGRDERFFKVPLFKEKVSIIAEKSHRPSLSPTDVLEQTIFAFHVTGSYHDRCLEWFSRHGAAPKRVIELPSYSAIIGSVAAGLGIAVVPLHWLEHFNCLSMVSVHELPQSLSYVQVEYVHLKHNDSANLRALESVLLESAMI